MLEDVFRRFVRHDALVWCTLDPAERVRVDYAVLHFPGAEIREATGGKWFGPPAGRDDCFPAGVYRFEESFPPKVGLEADWEEFTWGFSLALSG